MSFVREHFLLGNVPAWLGAFSLLLAYRIFRRDRTATDRTQIDLVGVWGTTDYERLPPDDEPPPDFAVEIQIHVNNASQLPISIAQIAYSIHSHWMVRDLEAKDIRAWSTESGTKPVRAFIQKEKAPIAVAPLSLWTNPDRRDISEARPNGADTLSPFDGARVIIDWALMIDNAGRKWELRPNSGKPARRINKRWRPIEYQPPKW